jgi:hypothetical protein
MVADHDFMRPLHAKTISADVVNLPDGYKAVDAEFEVDADAWDAFDEQRIRLGAPGGFSFTWSESFANFRSSDPTTTVKFHLSGDASHFDDDALSEAGREIAAVGDVQLARLYQLSAEQSCRIILQIIEQGPNPAAIAISVGSSVAAAAIFEGLKLLVRKPKKRPISGPPQIDFLSRRDSPEGTRQTVLQVRSGNEAVLKRAIDAIGPALAGGEAELEWDDEKRRFVPPPEKT